MGRFVPQHWLLWGIFVPGLFGASAVGEPVAGPGFEGARELCVWGDVTDSYLARFDLAWPGTKFEPLEVRWTATATDGPGLVDGDGITLTYSFVPDGTVIPEDPGFGNGDQPSNLFATMDAIYGSTAVWQAKFADVFARWGQLTGITYAFEPNDDGAAFAQFGVSDGTPGALGVRGDIRIAGYTLDGPGSGGLALNFFPNSGDMILDTANAGDFFADTSDDSLNLRNIVAHEHGHGLGLRHVCPRNETKLMEPNLTHAFDGPQIDDVLIAQKHYGDRYTGNSTVATAADLGGIDGATIVQDALSLRGLTDVDYFAVTVATTHVIDAAVTPLGGSYLSGPQNPNGSCSMGSLFVAGAQLNLAVALIHSDGITVLEQADGADAGNREGLSVKVGPGTYFVRVHATAGSNVQGYDLELSGTPSAGAVLRNERGGGIVALDAVTRNVNVDVSNAVAPVSMQWRKNGVALIEGGNLSGTETSALTISPLTIGDTGTYVLRVTDGSMATVTSEPIHLQVVQQLPAMGPAGLAVLWTSVIFMASVAFWWRSNYYDSRH